MYIRRTAVTLTVSAALLTTMAGCPSQSPSEPADDQGVEFEVDDCDAEDRRNREAECGLTKTKPTKAAPKGTAKPKSTPKARKTNR